MDIIVTTPKSEIKNAALEGEQAKEGLVTHYFRRLSKYPTMLNVGDKVFYVEDGYIRGYAIVEAIAGWRERCDTTKKYWPEGVFVWMKCDSWKWIEPIQMKGFQGFRYVTTQDDEQKIWGISVALVKPPCHIEYKIIGDWKYPKPIIE